MKIRFLQNAICFSLFLFASQMSGQSGGDFEIERSAIVPGGQLSNGDYSLESTIGQPAVGRRLFGPGFILQSGFWTANLAPTAAPVSVSGKVLSADGFAISNVVLAMINSAGESTTARSNQFGNFMFVGVLVGQGYVLTASGKSYQFVPKFLAINDSITDLELIALP